MSDEVQIIPEKAIYFTTRKTKEGWFAEKLYISGDKVVRERIGAVGSRGNALERFKIAVAKYWIAQHKGKI